MKEFKINGIYLNKNAMKILYKYFGHNAFGYYYEIIQLLLTEKCNIYEIKKLNKAARKLKIPRKRLECFIDICSQTVNNNGMIILNQNKKYFWSDELFAINKPKEEIKKYRKRGGRKRISDKDNIKWNTDTLVKLTLKQYQKLIQKYGKEFTQNAIKILDKWLKHKADKSAKYLNHNNYGHFRCDGWVIAETKRICSPDWII